jgi:hypothetical protein
MTMLHALEHQSLPPPSTQPLTHDDRVVGWLDGDAFAFLGFADASEASGAAWVAYRTVARRLARRSGRPLPPVDIQPVSLRRRGDHDVIVTGSLEVARLIRPIKSGDTYGFAIRVPSPADELTMRSLAYLAYRTLRRSGTRWSMWRPVDGPPTPASRSSEKQRRPSLSYLDGQPKIVVSSHAGTARDRRSPSLFVGRIVALFIVAVATIAIIAQAPFTVILPIGFALSAYLLGAAALWWNERRPRVRTTSTSRTADL